MSPRPPPKISLRHDWTKELGSKVARQHREEVATTASMKKLFNSHDEKFFDKQKFFQPNPKTNL